MNQEFINTLKKKLEKEKTALEKELKSFANQDKNLKGDWDARFPDFGKETGSADLEKAADEVEEYSALLPIEYALETKLRNINLALEKIKKSQYGKCEKCGQEIKKERLKIHPEAKLCLKCKG